MAKKKKTEEKDDSTGTYVFDKEQGKVVKVSNQVPGVSAKGKGGGDIPSLPCGRAAGDACGGCGMGGMGGF